MSSASLHLAPLMCWFFFFFFFFFFIFVFRSILNFFFLYGVLGDRAWSLGHMRGAFLQWIRGVPSMTREGDTDCKAPAPWIVVPCTYLRSWERWGYFNGTQHIVRIGQRLQNIA
ncbi:hypothetical protein LY78DRAFT_290031 [Colletotrichum sublineola]|nr:hypothetical protein LY78DRAFT_290031 [Colletotrichum sublineola]